MIWDRVHEEVTGLGYAEVSVSAPEGPYSARVCLEVEPASLLSDDARKYALLLLAAAEVADQADDEMVRAATHPGEQLEQNALDNMGSVSDTETRKPSATQPEVDEDPYEDRALEDGEMDELRQYGEPEEEQR